MNISADNLNGFELLELQKVTKQSLESMDNMTMMYGIVYIAKRRENKKFTWNNALEMSLGEVNKFLGVDEVVDHDVVDDEGQVIGTTDPKD